MVIFFSNPVTHDFVRAAIRHYPEPLARLILGTDNFAYQASWPIESMLGEYAGEYFDKARLLKAISTSIWDQTDFYSHGAHGILSPVFNDSGLPPDRKDRIFKIVEEVAVARIEDRITLNNQGEVRFREHGHHGRQYIARDSAGRLVREVLPPWTRALERHYARKA